MVKIYVEGGGATRALQSRCRQGFSELIQNSGFANRMPQIIACGSRKQAYDDFCTALKSGEDCYLLVDSESAIFTENDIDEAQNQNGEPWSHLKSRVGDQWRKPDAATNEMCHLMVECMENWLVADLLCLESYFGHGFKQKKIPTEKNPEKISKTTVYTKLEDATRDSKRGQYHKGDHSFTILKNIDPTKIIDKCPWAKRFFNQLNKVCK